MRAYLVPIVLLAWAAWTILLDGSLSAAWAITALIAAVFQGAHLTHTYREHHRHG